MSRRTPKDVWNELVDEAGEEEIERAASVSVEQAEKELAAAGFDVAAERATASAFLDALERGEIDTAPATAPATATATAARRPRPAILWLAAAATVTVAGGVLYAALHQAPSPAPPSPTPPPSTPPRPPSFVPDLVAAATLRREATAACDARSWSACLSKLDEARSADPAGDETPAMKSLRARALEGIEEKRRPEPPR